MNGRLSESRENWDIELFAKGVQNNERAFTESTRTITKSPLVRGLSFVLLILCSYIAFKNSLSVSYSDESIGTTAFLEFKITLL